LNINGVIVVEVIVSKKLGNEFAGTNREKIQFTKHFGIDIRLRFELKDSSTVKIFQVAIQSLVGSHIVYRGR
jgi:hypothetical protein